MLTVASVIGKESQTPVSPKRAENMKAIGIISISPRSKVMTCAGLGFAVEVKKIAIIILNPINTNAVKYNLSPDTAINCNCGFCSLLKMLVMGDAKKKIIP